MISVVIPLYNKEASIAHTLECVLEQSYRDFEIVIVDDGSKDNSPAIVESFSDTRIRLIRQENAGVSVARNKGIEEAKGEYVAFLDADDEWDIYHLENLSELIKKYPQCRAFATCYKFDIKGEDRPCILNKMPFDGEYGVLKNYFEVASCSHPPVCSSATCVEKKLLCEVGGFPVGIKSGEDLLTWARIALKTDWAYSMKPTATFVLGDQSVAKPRRRHEEVDKVGKALCQLYNEKPYLTAFAAYISLWFKMRAMCCLQELDRIGVFKESAKALKYNHRNYKVYAYCMIALMPSFVIRKLIEHFTR